MGLHDMQMTTREILSRAHRVIDKKLSGQERLDAIAFIGYKRRRAEDVKRLIERLEAKPDVERDCHPNSILSDAKVKAMIHERLDGATLAFLAEKYGISASAVQKAASGTQRRKLYEEVIAERSPSC